MCGIAGILELTRDARANAEALREMCRVMRHRGPDDDGFYTDGAAGIGMRRLSIVDLATGHQPISNEDGSLWIVFNGEIYNHPALREQLTACGHVYTTHSDTETILHAFEEYGSDCVQRLRGMFAFAIWDREDEETVYRTRQAGNQAAVLPAHTGALAVRIGNQGDPCACRSAAGIQLCHPA